MSTLAEIASAAERLPIREQHELLQQLSSKLGVQPVASKPETPQERTLRLRAEALNTRRQPRVLSRDEREVWMAELAELRKKNSTGRHSISIEQILDESREERL